MICSNSGVMGLKNGMGASGSQTAGSTENTGGALFANTLAHAAASDKNQRAVRAKSGWRQESAGSRKDPAGKDAGGAAKEARAAGLTASGPRFSKGSAADAKGADDLLAPGVRECLQKLLAAADQLEPEAKISEILEASEISEISEMLKALREQSGEGAGAYELPGMLSLILENTGGILADNIAAPADSKTDYRHGEQELKQDGKFLTPGLGADALQGGKAQLRQVLEALQTLALDGKPGGRRAGEMQGARADTGKDLQVNLERLLANLESGFFKGQATEVSGTGSSGTAEELRIQVERLLANLESGPLKGQSAEAQPAGPAAAEELRANLAHLLKTLENGFLKPGGLASTNLEADTAEELHTNLKRLLTALENGSSRGQHTEAARSGSDAGHELQAQLERLLKAAEQAPGPARAENAGEAAILAKAGDRAGLTEGHGQSQGEQSLRQLLNDLAAQAKNTGSEKPDAGAAGALASQSQEPETNLQNVEQLLKNMEARPGAAKDSGGKAAEILGQTQSPLQGNEKAEAAAAPMRQAAPGFDRALQGAENRIVSQVFVRLFSGVREGSGNMTINMHPPELGSVKVRILSDRGHLSVSFHPQNHQVVGVLEKHLPTLQQSLADQGIDVSDLQVSVDSGGEEGRSQFEEQAFASSNTKTGRPEAAENDPEQGTAGLSPAMDGRLQGLSLRV